jgi:hypothetical protein
MKNLYNKYLIIISLFLNVSYLWSCTKEGFSGEGSSTGKGGSLARFAIVGNHLYTVDNTSLRVFDINNPQSPQFIKRQDLGFGIETIFPYQDKLFLGANAGMYIIDISSPQFPQVLSIYQHVLSCDPVAVQNQYAYVTLRDGTNCRQGQNLLEVIDISNLISPKLLATYPMENPKGLGVDGSQLFVCDQGLKVFEIDSSRPWLLNQRQKLNISNAYDVIPLGGRLLLIGSDGLYQYAYRASQLDFISKIAVKK